MNRKTLTIALGVALIVAFFLPIISFGGRGASGLDIVQAGGGWESYLWLIFPICGALLLVGALNNGNYPGGRSLLSWLPFLTVLFILFIYPLIKGVDFGSLFKNLTKGWGAGLWLTVISSLLLAFYNPRS